MKAGVIAGEIFYKWLSGYTYEVKVALYSEIGSASLTDCCEDTLYFGDGTSAVVLRSNGAVGNCLPAHDGAPISANIKYSEYVTTHVYPGPGNYYIHVFSSCKRDSSIINIVSSDTKRLILEALLVISNTNTNPCSSPTFYNRPIDTACVNSGCFYFSSVGNDINADSLSYEIAPCNGMTGYTYPYVGAFGTFSINPTSGVLAWCNPIIAGKNNVLVVIKKWRNNGSGTYTMVGYSQRDVRIVADVCAGIYEPTLQNNRVSVSPNPFSNTIIVSSDKPLDLVCDMELLDVTGREVSQLSIHQLGTSYECVLLGDKLDDGIYFLKITDKKLGVLLKKIIKH